MYFVDQKTDRGLVCLAVKEGEDRRYRGQKCPLGGNRVAAFGE